MKLISIKSLLPVAFKKHLVSYLRGRQAELPGGARAFLFLAADYGNIGDLAITAAQKGFLQKHAPARTVVPVPISATRQLIRSIRKQIRPQDLITIVGGGNMGSLYPDIEELRQLVIRSFPRNRIICFPQTLDWSDSAESERALARIVSVYSRHSDLHVFARESITREKLKMLFRTHSKVHVGYAPDIVLSATASALGSTVQAAPSGILLCLRDDRESSIDRSQRAELEIALKDTGHPLAFTDTHAGGYQLDSIQCARLVAQKIDEFSAARLVVTDRLHGMILSVIAGTPCLVLPNSNHKIYQTWRDWLSNVAHVKFVAPGNASAVPDLIAGLLALPKRHPELTPVDYHHYDEIKRAIAQP